MPLDMLMTADRTDGESLLKESIEGGVVAAHT
jgi:hypothetical protein